MKKWFVIIMALILAVVCLTGCSKDEDKSSSSSSTQKPTQEQAQEQTTQQIQDRFKISLQLGETIKFGRYEQDNNLDNGPEPIEWIVLDKQDGKALLLSRHALDGKHFHEELANVTWEDCTLRAWLNNDFLRSAFTEEEQSAILVTEVDNSSDQGYYNMYFESTPGNNTMDRIFLLSYHEAYKQYFTSDKSRLCAPTDYALANGAHVGHSYQADGRYAGFWLLRTSGINKNSKQPSLLFVGHDGQCSDIDIDTPNKNVRPALWINLDSGIF